MALIAGAQIRRGSDRSSRTRCQRPGRRLCSPTGCPATSPHNRRAPARRAALRNCGCGARRSLRGPHGENMQGTDTSVDVPHEVTLLNAMTSSRASSGVVGRAYPPSSEKLAARTVSPTTSTNTRGFCGADRDANHARIGTHGLARGARVCAPCAARTSDEAVDVVAGRDEITQLALIAHQRGEIARDQQDRQHGDHEGAGHRTGAHAARIAATAARSMRTHQMNATGSADHSQHGTHHRPGNELLRFVRVGLEDVLDHGRIHHHRVGAHEIRSRRRSR